MYEIVTYPNKILYSKSEDVVLFNKELHNFLDNLYETMIAFSGIGIAAIQVSKPINVFIINLINENEIQDKEDLLEFINPKIFPITEKTTIYEEGCLSVPGFFENVERYEKIKISYQDRYGNHKELEAEGLLAIAIQHEFDHLNGHLFVEKINFNGKKKLEKYLKRKKKK